MNKEKLNKVGFNQDLEANFLATLDNFEVRKQVLEDEVATAVHEAFLQKFENGYYLKDGKIVDKKTLKPLEDLVFNCGHVPEIEAMVKIQKELNSKTNLVVNFSPRNEEYDYPMDCVDFWWQTEEEIRWLRVVVKNDFESLKKIYNSLGGEKVDTVMELLANPIGINDLKIGEILAMMDTMEEINKITDIEIRESVKLLMEGFVSKFDREITENPDVIFRLFSAAIAEAKKINKEKEKGFECNINGEIDMWMYLNASMETRMMNTGGCASFNNVGEFGSGQGYIILRSSDGSIRITKGEVPEGYKYCEHCGMYYDGDKCPVCN